MKVKLVNNYELEIKLKQQVKRIGVNSCSFDEPNKHMIIWDFDYVSSIKELVDNLIAIQFMYELSTIYIIESSKRKYHGYCFTKRTFKELLHILSDTPMICDDYLRIGAIRGFYTLRISKRNDCQFRLVTTIPSDIIPDMLPSECSLAEYLTYNKGGV